MILYTSVISYIGNFEMMIGLSNKDDNIKENYGKNCKKMTYQEKFIEDEIERSLIKPSNNNHITYF